MRKLASVALFLFVSACADNLPLAPLSDAAGTYTLRSVDGSPLPFVYLEAVGYKDEIMSGTVALSADGRFRDETLYRRTRDGVVLLSTVALEGTWSLRGDVVTFSPEARATPGRVYTMRRGGTRLTLVELGLTSIFER
ncbi:MAG: hypothetical protein ABR499_05780 [Gemmatimonadaceae bacterium]